MTALLSVGEHSLLQAARHFLISHNVRMSPLSVQFSSNLDFFFFHLMSSSLDDVVFFLSSLIIESEEAGVQVGERLYSQPSEHPSACVDKKDECSESVQGQSER